MVNSEEGYQNLQRFLFGDIKVKAVLCDSTLDFDSDRPDPEAAPTYLFETQISIRGLPILMHERTLAHYCAQSLNREQYEEQMQKGGLPLFSTFLMSSRKGRDGSIRYMMRLAVYKQWYRKGFLLLRDHLERLPLWSDYIVIELRPPNTEQADQGLRYVAFYSWASIKRNPDQMMTIPPGQNGPELDLIVPLLEGKPKEVLGSQARITLQTFNWN
jgi:hypothetical protein